MTLNILSFTTAGIFCAIGLLHVYWALGGKSASPNVIPSQVDPQHALCPQ
jgi:hypothetical protein